MQAYRFMPIYAYNRYYSSYYRKKSKRAFAFL